MLRLFAPLGVGQRQSDRRADSAPLLSKMMRDVGLELGTKGVGNHDAENATTDRSAKGSTEQWTKYLHPDRHQCRHDAAGNPGFPQLE